MQNIKFLLVLSMVFTLGAAWADTAMPASKKKKSSLQDLLKKAGGSSSSSPTAVAGVRGLDEVNGEVDTKARDFKSIDKLEGIVIHDEDVKKFVEEGNLK